MNQTGWSGLSKGAVGHSIEWKGAAISKEPRRTFHTALHKGTLTAVLLNASEEQSLLSEAGSLSDSGECGCHRALDHKGITKEAGPQPSLLQPPFPSDKQVSNI